MSLANQIAQDYLAAYKAHDAVRISVLRLLKTAMTNRLVELKQPGGTLDDAAMLDLILKQAKQRKDSIEQYAQANRSDLAEKEAAELAILQEYLPQELSAAELAAAVDEAIALAGQQAKPGPVMGMLMKKYKGRIDAGAASEAIMKKLGAKS